MPLTISDRTVHWLLVAGGMFVFALLHTGFEWVANKFWRKVDQEAEDLKAFRAWKKAGKPPA